MSIKYNLISHAEAVTIERATHSGINSTSIEVSTQWHNKKIDFTKVSR
jgi:hypothetical protein